MLLAVTKLTRFANLATIGFDMWADMSDVEEDNSFCNAAQLEERAVGWSLRGSPVVKPVTVTAERILSNTWADISDSEVSTCKGDIRETSSSWAQMSDSEDICADMGCSTLDKGAPLALDEGMSLEVPTFLLPLLKEHQRDGVDFVFSCFKAGGGCILADDMGLGKTLQAIATVCSLVMGQNYKRKALVLCPASLLGNWKKEFAKWAGKRVEVSVIGLSRRLPGTHLGQLGIYLAGHTLQQMQEH